MASSVNLTLCECCERSPNTISTTFSPCFVVAVFKVTSFTFSNALCALRKPVINSSFTLKLKSLQ